MDHGGERDGSSVARAASRPDARGQRGGLTFAPVDARRWDEFVASVPGDVVAQTSAWARTKVGSHELVAAFEGDELVGGCMVLERTVGPVRVAYAPRGPIVRPGHEASAEQIVSEVVRQTSTWRPNVLIVQPASAHPAVSAALTRAGFGPAPIDIAPSASVEIDLTRDEEEILAAMRQSRRRNIRKAERLGVEVRVGDRDDLATFHELHVATAARQGFTPLSLDYLTRQWEVLAPIGAMRVHVACLDDAPLAAATVTAFGDRVVFKLAGLSDDPGARDARASDYLHWKVLCSAREDGFAFYDLGGFDRDAALVIEQGGEPPEELRSSASQFKLGFAGTVVTRPRAMWRLGPGAIRHTQRPLTAALTRFPRLRDRLILLRAD